MQMDGLSVNVKKTISDFGVNINSASMKILKKNVSTEKIGACALIRNIMHGSSTRVVAIRVTLIPVRTMENARLTAVGGLNVYAKKTITDFDVNMKMPTLKLLVVTAFEQSRDLILDLECRVIVHLLLTRLLKNARETKDALGLSI